MGLTPLEMKLHKYNPLIISQIMQIIEVDNVWHQKTFKALLIDLLRRGNEGIHKQKDISIYSTENSEINDEMDGVDIVDLCSESKTRNGEQCKGRESSKQKSRDKMKINTIIRKKGKNRPGEGKPMTENKENKSVMMCWEVLKESPRKESHVESENEGEKPVKKTQKP